MRRAAIVVLGLVSLIACGGRTGMAGEQDAAAEPILDAGADVSVEDARDASDAASPFCEPGTREVGQGAYEQCVCQDVTPSDAVWMLQLSCEHGERRLDGGCHVADGGVLEDVADAGASSLCIARVGGDAGVLFCVKLTCQRPG